MKDRVRLIRKHFALTQEQFANKIHRTSGFISNVENGKSIPSDEFLSAVSREFNVSYLWLRTGEADERDPVDERLIEWLRRNPEVARELRIRSGLD